MFDSECVRKFIEFCFRFSEKWLTSNTTIFAKAFAQKILEKIISCGNDKIFIIFYYLGLKKDMYGVFSQFLDKITSSLLRLLKQKKSGKVFVFVHSHKTKNFFLKETQYLQSTFPKPSYIRINRVHPQNVEILNVKKQNVKSQIVDNNKTSTTTKRRIAKLHRLEKCDIK
jgi:hypothetical protein